MILDLTHSRLEVYFLARQVVKECYKITSGLPFIERFNLIQQINRAALSVVLNIAEGASRKSINERRRFYEISRSSLIEIEAALQVGIDLRYLNENDIDGLRTLFTSCFRMLSKMILTLSK